MYGVVEIAGHQYKVQAGDLIDVEKLAKEEGSLIELDCHKWS
jgi:large subunit ribosomal protein L21